MLAAGCLLVNLCNLAPLAGGRSITMIHDAQVFISPNSYSRAFRSWYQFALPRIGKSSQLVLTVSEFSRGQLEHYGVAPRSNTSTNTRSMILRLMSRSSFSMSAKSVSAAPVMVMVPCVADGLEVWRPRAS